jgi:PhnB protein
MAKNVRAVPEGYGTVTPFLNIKGASEAIELYKKAFGVEERFKMMGPSNTIMHCELQLGTSKIMVSEAMMQPPTQSSLHLYVDDCDAMWARATGAGLKVEMPMANMFWGDRYGVLSDRHGNRWAIATHVEDISEDEMKRRAAAEIAKLAQQKK